MRWSRHKAALAVLAVLLAGCFLGSHPLMLGPAAGAEQATCDATTCKDAWDRAQVWISRHSKWKIQVATDVTIETYNPTGYDPSYGFSATKEPMGGGRYTISLSMHCGNSLGCDPRPGDVLSVFNHYVAGGGDVLATVGHGGAVR